jgi:hypothetical protein
VAEALRTFRTHGGDRLFLCSSDPVSFYELTGAMVEQGAPPETYVAEYRRVADAIEAVMARYAAEVAHLPAQPAAADAGAT